MKNNNSLNFTLPIIIMAIVIITNLIIKEDYFFKDNIKKDHLNQQNDYYDLDNKDQVVNKGVVVEGLDLGGKNLSEVKNILKKSKITLRKEAQNAFIFKGEIFPEIIGEYINLNKTIKKIISAPKNQQLKATYDLKKPLITRDNLIDSKIFTFELKNSTQKSNKIKVKLLGHYTTFLNNNNHSRRKNIILALKELDYCYLNPKKIFSFNQIIGLPTLSKGYQKAPIINSDRFIPKVGGGICQVSSTLYNAIIEANLEIIEHHHHSKKISYVPEDKDATIVPGQKDFKFKNNQEYPIIILTDIIDRYVIIYILRDISN